MLRTLRYVIGAAAILVAGTSLAQPPAGSELFPFKKGSKWTYKVADQKVEVVVVGQEKFENVDCWKLETSVNGQVKATELYKVAPDGIYRVRVKDEKIDPPVKVIALPLGKKDAAWPVDSKIGSQSLKGTFKIKEETTKVKVPAGEFDAVLIEGDNFEIAGTKATIRQWFAKDKGAVKLVYVISGTESVLELEKYEEGK
ncbi:MAG: hypothetical protein K2P78_04975 [Gemmataceae bacterium]|nr:hypothetical protein [Gemmataceae bacterium]